ncbi:LysR substrate-binding domain-containing protein [Mesorhizobium sp. SB112]|uniref:LysR substrate-binding domain-containing protein n=1 Tax=Mesorhizobium sp. SB112 TaxID=3151853 RepID=UPI0032636753
MNLSLRALRYVVETADCGSVTEAAKRLNVSQPSVSMALSQVETELGVQIFVRHHARGVTLSAAGQRLVNDARLLLNHARDFAQSAHSLGDALRGEIVVGCFPTLAIRFMPGLLSGFSKRYPGISVKLEEGDQQEMIGHLVSGRTELALSYNFAVPEEITGEKLADFPPLVLVSADHRLADREEVSLVELEEEPFILLDLPHSRDYFFNIFSACGLEPRIAFRTRSSELIRGLVGHGHGYSLHNVAPQTTIGYDGSRIAVLKLAETLPPATVTFLRLTRHDLRPAVQAFADYMRESFARGGIFG